MLMVLFVPRKRIPYDVDCSDERAAELRSMVPAEVARRAYLLFDTVSLPVCLICPPMARAAAPLTAFSVVSPLSVNTPPADDSSAPPSLVVDVTLSGAFEVIFPFNIAVTPPVR